MDTTFLFILLSCYRCSAQLSSLNPYEVNSFPEKEQLEGKSKEQSGPPFVVRLVDGTDYSTIGSMQDVGYCLQSMSLVEPSNLQANYQTAFIFSQQPSCTAWFTSRSMNASDFVRQVQAASLKGYVPTQFMAPANPQLAGGNKLSSFAEYARGVSVQVRHMEQTNAGETRHLRMAGYQLLKLFGFTDIIGLAAHFGVWVMPALSLQQRQAHYGLSFAECIQLDATMALDGYTPVQLQVFAVDSEARCAAVWEKARPGTRHRIQLGTNLTDMAGEMQPTGMNPVQVSSYVDSSNAVNFVILWSSATPARYPGLWEAVPAPMSYLVGSEEGFLPADLAKVDARIRGVMKKQSVMSFSYAISKGEQLKIAAAYGYADPTDQTPLNTNNRFRIASVSKTLSSTAIFRLIELGRLSLDRQIFGPGAIFGSRYGRPPYSEKLKAIKLIHLLQHTEGGWSGREGDGFPDPTDNPQHLNADQLISYVIDHYPLNFTAGAHFKYCNFGYFLVGRIIEEVTGELYEDFVKREILTPQGMSATQLGRNGLAGRLPDEIAYTDHDGSIYGVDLEMNKAVGAWVTTAVDLLKFISGVNGFPLRRDLLRAATLERMVRPTAVSKFRYASGWITVEKLPLRGRGHSGGLSGLASWLWRRDDGFEWSILMSGYSTEQLYMSSMLGLLAAIDGDITQWPAHDLYGSKQ